MKTSYKLMFSVFLVIVGISIALYLNQPTIEDKSTPSAEASAGTPKQVASEKEAVASPTINPKIVEDISPKNVTPNKNSVSPATLKTKNNNAPVIKPVSIAFKDAVRKLEKKETVQLKRTLADGSVVMDTVEAETSATVVVITEDGKAIQGHGGLVLNAPETNVKKPK